MAASAAKPKKAKTNRSQFVVGKTEDINKYYTLQSRIGQPGQFGHAVRAIHKATKEVRAVKVVNKARFARSVERDFHMMQLRAEIGVMKKMEHENIIRFYEVFENETDLYIVMELCTGGELFERIKQTGQYTEQNAAQVLRGMCEGIAYMHSQRIAHCDLKPDNFLFASEAKNATIKIIDFGMSKFVKKRKYFKSLCGTPYYVAPEVIRGQYNHHSDMWSLGVVMFVMLFGYPPFYSDKGDQQIFECILRGFSPETKDGFDAHFPSSIPCSESAKDLMAKLLTLNVAKRLTAEEALQHPWLQGKTALDTPISPTVMKQLRGFVGSTRLRASILGLMTDQLTDTDIAELKKTFEAMDENKDGKISVDELRKAMEKDGGSEAAKNVDAIFKAADIDGDGVLSYEELLLTAVNRKMLAKEERIYQAFVKMDLDGDGRLTKQEIEAVLGADDAAELMKKADVDGDGTVDYSEFMDAMASDKL